MLVAVGLQGDALVEAQSAGAVDAAPQDDRVAAGSARVAPDASAFPSGAT
jgi:hypothetical protein